MTRSKLYFLALAAVALWACAPAMAATVAQWHFNENTGNTAADSSGNGHNIVNLGIGTGSGYSWMTGHSGSAASGAIGNDSYLYADLGTGSFSTQMTIDAWINPTSTAAPGSGQSRMIMTLLNSMFLRENADGYGIGFGIRTTAGWMEVDPWVTGTPWAYHNTGWHHLVCVYNGDAGHVRLYWDGVLIAMTTFDVSAGSLVMGAGDPVGPAFLIGGSAGDPTNSLCRYEGGIDEVTLSNVDLYPIPSTKMIGRYHMDDGSGTTITDSGAFGNDLTINGSGWTWTTGKVNGGILASDSSTGYAMTNTNTFTPVPSRQLTAQAWIKPTSYDPYVGSNVFGMGWCFGVNFIGNGQNAIRLVVASHNPSNPTTGHPNGDPNTDGWREVWFGPVDTKLMDGNWHHIAVVFDGIQDAQGKSHLRFYYDFNLSSDVTFSMPLALGFTWQLPTRKLVVGAGWDVYDAPYYGYMDEVEIDAAALTKFGCGANGYLAGDVNQDCKVDFKDFAGIAATWLKCNDPFNAACN